MGLALSIDDNANYVVMGRDMKTTVGLHPTRIVTLCVFLSWIGLLGLSKLLLDNEAVQWVLESIAVVGGGVILLMVRRSK